MKRFLALAVSVCMALTVFAASPEIMKVVPGADAEVSAASYPALKTINYKATGDQRKDIVGFAKTQVGYAEKSGNNTYFGAWYGMNKQPWCAMFICWAASKAGVATSIIPKLANADRGWAKKQGVYYKSKQWGGNYTPKAGDLFYFSWSVRDYADHIGLVSGTGKSGNTTYVYTIEGNKHDKVKEGSYALNNRYILGYASPKYKSSTPTTTTKPTTTTTKPTTTTTKPTTAAITVKDGEYLLKYRDGLTETENEDSIVAPAVGTFGKDMTISSYKFSRPGYDYNTWNIYREDKGKLYYLCRDKASGATEKWYLSSAIPSDYALATVGIGGKLRVNTKVPGPLYLTPVWFASGYAVTYNANGGQNAPAGQTKKQGQTLTLQSGVPTKAGCTFQGWAETANATTPKYSPGGSYTADKAITLFAVWKSGTFQVKLTGDLYLRTGPAKTYKSVGVLKKGKTVTVVETKDGWAKLTDGNWISMKYTQTITTAAPTTKPTTKPTTRPTVPQITTTRAASSGKSSASGAGVYKTKATLNKRKGPGKNYKVVGTVKYGAKVTIVEVKNGWGKTSDGGWMSMKYLKKVSSAPAQAATTAASTGYFNVKVAVGALNKRSGPGATNKRKGTLHKGDSLKITKVSNGWGQIKGDGSWISLKYTTVTSGCKVRVTSTTLPMRKGPGKKYDKVGVVQPGVHDISKINGTWGKLRSNGRWIHLGYTTWAY